MVRADSCAGSSQAVPLYRDWNPSISDHFYTVHTHRPSKNNSTRSRGVQHCQRERVHLRGLHLSIFSTQVAGSVQFIRLWNARFSTTNATEAQVATGGGYIIETQAEKMYIYPTQLCGSVPLYRPYSAGGTDHFYTINATEMNGAETSRWAYELIAGYVFPPPADASSGTAATPTTATSTEIATTATTAAAPPQSTACDLLPCLLPPLPQARRRSPPTEWPHHLMQKSGRGLSSPRPQRYSVALPLLTVSHHHRRRGPVARSGHTSSTGSLSSSSLSQLDLG
ncbi:hypothetical protein DFH07DRAFT_936936 [Mycena maculata]|uniref:DUF5648 domain-containing protein n=1 Tax=Mycena maculata TaxID=230809 RepID=A0AAD7NUS0_9AGAR|nr:hypothetical protein DFH07DRAFT_936936 [Mycena maculata]